MRIIPTRIHGAIDYVMGAVLVLSPWLFGFAVGGPAQWVPIVIGLAMIVTAMLTRYELGLVPMLSMPAHIAIDVIAGIVLAFSPWLFGFAAIVYVPHLVLGLLEAVGALITETRPETVRPAASRPLS
jgi:hypothetical protein